MEYVAKDAKIRQIRVEYKHSAMYGHEMVIKTGANVVAMYSKEGDLYAAVEYEVVEE